jgi:2-methylcitrate dehydratase PrpD
MHIGFCAAVQLIEGDVFVEQMVEENVARPDLVELANRIRVVHDKEREQKGFELSRGAAVEVRLKNGEILKKTVDYRPGSQRCPLTEEQMTKKFRRMAAKVLSAAKIAEIENIVANLDRAPNIEPLVAVLRG